MQAEEAEARQPGWGRSEEGLAAIVAARNEAERIAETLAALRGAFPEAALWVADDASTDGTAEVAIAAGAQVEAVPARTAREPTSQPPPGRRSAPSLRPP